MTNMLTSLPPAFMHEHPEKVRTSRFAHARIMKVMRGRDKTLNEGQLPALPASVGFAGDQWRGGYS
jgi:hypothetical protein